MKRLIIILSSLRFVHICPGYPSSFGITSIPGKLTASLSGKDLICKAYDFGGPARTLLLYGLSAILKPVFPIYTSLKHSCTLQVL
jgi:hypothetical protein